MTSQTRIRPRPAGRRRRRRTLAVLVVVLALAAACGAPDGPTDPSTGETSPPASASASDPSPSAPAPEPSTTPDPPSPSPSASDQADAAPAWTRDSPVAWTPGEGEVLVDAKRRAAVVAEQLLTYDPDDTLTARQTAVAGDDTDPALLRGAADADHPASWSRTRTLYPQMGGFAIGADEETGLLPDVPSGSERQTAAVMVLVEQRWGTDDEPTVERRLVDVRLERPDADSAWQVVEVPSAGGLPVQPPSDPHPVLTHDRISLPDSARWDIAAGMVDERLLDLMVDIAARWTVEVVALDLGHPDNVFATDRISAHKLGRAVDIHVVDGATVASSHALDSPARAMVEWLYDDERVTKIGSPWALDGFGGRSFTDIVHADHVHIAVPRPATD